MELWAQPLAYDVPAVPAAPAPPRFAPGADTGGSATDLITGLNYFNEDSGSPRESLINAFSSSNYANNSTGGAANGNVWGCNDSLGVPCAGPVRRLRITGDSSTTQESTAYGLFANGTIHFTDRISFDVNRSYGM